MTIIEYTPQNLTGRIQHRKRIQRMTDGIMPRNTAWVMLIACVLVVAFFLGSCIIWWNAGAIAEGYDWNTYVRVTVSDDSGLCVRRGPGTEYYASSLIGNGYELILKDTRPGWALVASPKYPDTPLGWVCSDYLEVVR